MRRAALLAAVLVLAGCGAAPGGQFGSLGWVESPHVFRPERLPDDRVLIGEVRNESLRELALTAKDVRVRDASGLVLDSSAQFTNSFAHGLYGVFQRPDPLPPEEITRLGLAVTLAAGKSTPITVAFRLTNDAEPPFEVDYGVGALPVPEKVEPTAGG